MQVLFVGHVEG